MKYYKKEDEMILFASETPPIRLDGLVEITEEEYNRLIKEILTQSE